jgi:hypothetical protein
MGDELDVIFCTLWPVSSDTSQKVVQAHCLSFTLRMHS